MKWIVQILPAEVQLKFWHLKQRKKNSDLPANSSHIKEGTYGNSYNWEGHQEKE